MNMLSELLPIKEKIISTDVDVVNSNIAAANFNENLFSDFIKYLDRGEKTTRTYLNNLKQFWYWLKDNNIAQPQREDIILYRQYLAAKCKPNTVRLYLQSVRQLFSWTAANSLYPNIAANIHAPKVKTDTHRKEALAVSDVINIENSIKANAIARQYTAAAASKDSKGKAIRANEQDKRLYAMYLLAVNCGLRTIEIHRANIGDIETKNGISYIYVCGKGHTEADTKKTLAKEVKAAIDDYLSTRTDTASSSPLFVSTGNRSKGKRIATTTISTMLKKAMIKAGYDSERITAHSLRHTTGTAIQEITDNLYLTQQYMRHANPQTTEIYLHNDTEQKESELAQQLYNYYHNITDDKDNILNKLTAEQLFQLSKLAAAITN